MAIGIKHLIGEKASVGRSDHRIVYEHGLQAVMERVISELHNGRQAASIAANYMLKKLSAPLINIVTNYPIRLALQSSIRTFLWR